MLILSSTNSKIDTIVIRTVCVKDTCVTEQSLNRWLKLAIFGKWTPLHSVPSILHTGRVI
jgi:hypothetical protein